MPDISLRLFPARRAVHHASAPCECKKTLLGLILLFVIVTLGNNVVKHDEALHVIERSYAQMNKASK